MMKALFESERNRESGRRGWVKKRKSMAAGKEFLDGTHRYERTFSNERVGEFRVMGGREAKELNDSLFDKFLAAVEMNVKGRSLERWCLVERNVTP